MSSRDRYTVPLHCIACGKTGTAHWSEWDRPTQYSGLGRQVDAVTEGFAIVPSTMPRQGSEIRCTDCGVEV